MATNILHTHLTLKDINCEDGSSLISFSRDKRATIAKDTLNILQAGWYHRHGGPRISLEKDIRFSVDNTLLYTEYDLEYTKKLILDIDKTSFAKIEVHQCTTLQAAQLLVSIEGEDRVGVLNFASAKNPGGGFLKGSNAQEESLARSSSLYSSLSQSRLFTQFYGYHRRGKTGIYSHRIIYSPRVTIFKDDNGKLLSSPYNVGIVTVPAPNASVVRDEQLVQNTMTERIKRLLDVFQEQKLDTLVLGAFGCGVFRNNPLDVANTFKQHLLSEEFKNCFKRIVFAVLDPDMCQIFKQVFDDKHLTQIETRNAPISINDRQNKQEKQTKKRNNVGEKIQDGKSLYYGQQQEDEEQ